jgi:hypothetical protein
VGISIALDCDVAPAQRERGAISRKLPPRLFYVSGDDKLMVVTLQMRGDGMEPSAPREVFAFGQSFYTSLYDVAPDGRRILIQQREAAAENIEVIVNWPALLRKEAAAP